jgi:MarR family transcriptional regulator, organic hydroperoxide resistance regulator
MPPKTPYARRGRAHPPVAPAISGILRGLRQAVKALEDSSRELYLQYGLTASQLWLLRTLEADGPIPAGPLARQLAIHPSTLTALAARLEQRGLITRARESSDRRFVRLRLTPAGARLATRAPVTPQGRLVRALHALPPGRLRRLQRAVADLVKALDAHGLPSTPMFTRLDR